jgi:hypothetical protein
LSPLLTNVLLDEVDKELEKRGHAFVRYADDCNVYVRSQRAGERVMRLLVKLYGRLRLRINESKSAVARVWDRKFLGFAFWVTRKKQVRPRVHRKALVEMKDRLRHITRQVAANARRWWRNSAMAIHIALPNSLFDGLGVPRLAASPQPSEPPGADPHAGWCGRGPRGKS